MTKKEKLKLKKAIDRAIHWAWVCGVSHHCSIANATKRNKAFINLEKFVK